MNKSIVELILQADTASFSASIRQAEQEFSTRLKRMDTTSTAQSNRISGNFKALSGGVSSFTEQLKKAAKQLVLMAGAITGIGFLGKHMIGIADNMTIAADRVGITTGLLQELRFAASLTGVETEKLDSAISTFTRQIGKAASGTGPAAELFEKLGISVHDSDGTLRDSEGVLKDVADALSRMGSQAERAAVTTILFGKEGMALNLMLGKGAEGIESFQQQARELGIVIDEKLLRSSEKANVQLQILSTVVKSHIVTAFAQLTPLIIDFSQKVVSALPQIRGFFSKLSDLKDAFVGLVKVIVVAKIVNFAAGLVSAAKSFVVASVGASKFALAVTYLGKALGGLALSVAIVTAIDALSLLKQHMDLRSEAKNFIQTQYSIIDSSQQFSNAIRISAQEFEDLSKVEQESYVSRIKAAQSFWHARLTLEAREDPQSEFALYAAKQNRLYLENLRDIETFFSKRTDLEKNHALLVNKIRTEETNALKLSLSVQLKEYDKANAKLQTLKEKQKNIAKEFREFISEISSSPKKQNEDLSVLDISSTQLEAKKALEAGNIEEAMRAVNQSKDMIRELAQAGNVSKSYLTEQAKLTANIADDIVNAEIQAQEKSITNIKEKIGEIKAHAEILKHLTIEFDDKGAIKSADELRNAIQEKLAKNPIKISTVVIPDGHGIDSRAEQILKPQKKARGGYILGPGTSMSDSILARLSRGEYVLRAAAVKHYGVGVLSRMNHMQLPKYAKGGLVPPNVPLIKSSAPSSGQTASLTLNLGGKHYNIKTHDIDVIEGLSKAVAREALKSGRIL